MITAVDEAHATFKHKSGGKLTVYFILCNSPRRSLPTGGSPEARPLKRWSEQ